VPDTTADKKAEDEVFFTALQIADPGERKAFIDQACAGKSNLRSLVEEMLVSEEEAERWLYLGTLCFSQHSSRTSRRCF